MSNYVSEKYSIEIQVLEARHFCTEKEKKWVKEHIIKHLGRKDDFYKYDRKQYDEW